MRRALIAAIVLLVVGLAIFHKQLIHHAVSTQDTKRLVVGEKVPDFTLSNLAGKIVKLSELQKRTDSGVVCLSFWCTTCHSCRMMDVRFQKLAADWGSTRTPRTRPRRWRSSSRAGSSPCRSSWTRRAKRRTSSESG